MLASLSSSRWLIWLRTPYAMAGMVLAVGVLTLAWPLPAPPPEAPQTLRITDRQGVPLRTLYPNGRHRPVSLNDVDTVAVQALLATEDQRFYTHIGIDVLSVLGSAWANLRAGRVVRGASTVTMQVAKALRGGPERSWWNKMAEAHLALRLELRWSKDRILETWLNRVSFGNRAHGIEAAARLYFGTSARDLTPHQSTYLVGLPQRPGYYNPYRFPERAARRQRHVLGALVEHGVITTADSAEWADVPLRVRQPSQTRRAPHFTTMLLQNANDDARSAREWRTTLDAALQARIEARVQTRLHRLRDQNVTNAAVLVLDNERGAIRAYVGSRNFWNDAIAGENDGVRMQRQPGSTLKPFLYGHTLDQRTYTPASILPDIPLHVPSAGGAFTPSNYDNRFHGPVPLREALAASYNVPAVYVAREIGPSALLTTLRQAGFDTLDRTGAHYGVGLALGNGEVRLIDLAEAYAGLARGGARPTAHARTWTRTATGDTLHHTQPTPAALGLAPATTVQLTDMLSDAEARAPGFGVETPLELPFPVAVKTGTSKDYRDNWTVGYTPQHTVAVWVGNFDGSPMQNV
ncbi:MAG: penicillin-binding protein 1C, partial [Longimonas sp.]|uniref:penicillin-binding protein 1C n=1 Tax=Longimonas sp. TaxID=2039626 RepID=UPI0039768CEF